jgi:chlorobactene glucosyltransferase
MYTGWSSLAEGLGKNAVAGYRSGGLRSGLAGARLALVAFLPLYLLGAGALLAYTQPVSGLGGALLAHGAALLAVALVCWGWIARHRYRVAAGWGALFPLGLAAYFGLAARALILLRIGRGVAWKGRTFG